MTGSFPKRGSSGEFRTQCGLAQRPEEERDVYRCRVAVGYSRIPARFRTNRDERPNALPMPSHHLVYRVEKPSEAEHAKSAPERSGELDLYKHGDATTGITRHSRAIAAHEPPAFLPPFL